MDRAEKELGLKSTYTRMVGDRAFEYGWAFPGRNVRNAKIFEPAGVECSFEAADARRASLLPLTARAS